MKSETSSIFPTIPIVEWINQAIDRTWIVGSLQALEELEEQLKLLLS